VSTTEPKGHDGNEGSGLCVSDGFFLIDILLIIEYSHIGFRMEKFRGVGTV
jgi:hypothetical protein